MSTQAEKTTAPARARLDRPCPHLAQRDSSHAPWNMEEKRGALDLERDGSQHRRYQSLYEDLLN